MCSSDLKDLAVLAVLTGPGSPEKEEEVYGVKAINTEQSRRGHR